MAKYNKITDKDIEFIKNNNQLSPIELSKKLNKHPVTIRKIASNNNIKLKRHKIIYEYENFFKKWSIEMAYVLGFIAADGCVMLKKRNGGIVEITLSIKDLEHLKKIKKIINCPQKISIKKTNFGTIACRLSIGSIVMAKDLISLGIIQKKSLNLEFPKNIKKKYISHFIRGYLDGDGCLELIKRNNSPNLNLRCSILGTIKFLTFIKQYYSNKIYKKNIGSIYKINNIYCLSYSGINSSKSFCDWLYSESTENIRLDRKFYIYNKFIENNLHYYSSSFLNCSNIP